MVCCLAGICLKSPCRNWGACVESDGGNNFTCYCSRGFNGSRCQSIIISLNLMHFGQIIFIFLDFTGEKPFFCGGLLPYPSGTFYSPGFPVSYFGGLRCLWLLASFSRREQLVLFSFDSFKVDTQNDSFQVFRLRNNTEWEIFLTRNVLCGDGETECLCNDSTTFLAHRFYVVFTSDSEGEGTGFEISYSSLGVAIRLKYFILLTTSICFHAVTGMSTVATTFNETLLGNNTCEGTHFT